MMRAADECGWEAGQVTLGAFHLMGTAHMGSVREDSVCDPERRGLGRQGAVRRRRLGAPDRSRGEPDGHDRGGGPQDRPRHGGEAGMNDLVALYWTTSGPVEVPAAGSGACSTSATGARRRSGPGSRKSAAGAPISSTSWRRGRWPISRRYSTTMGSSTWSSSACSTGSSIRPTSCGAPPTRPVSCCSRRRLRSKPTASRWPTSSAVRASCRC